MAEKVFTLSDAARMIPISRPTLYKYLSRPEYEPTVTAGYPTLTRAQINGIKRERRNGGPTKKR